MKQLRVISVENVVGKYPSSDTHSDVDYEIEFVDLPREYITILLPKRYFEPLIIDNNIIVEATMIYENELYSCKFEGIIDETFCYSLQCGDKNFNLYYDEKFEELH